MSENSNGVYGVELADAAQKVNAAAVTVAEVASNAVSGAAPEVQVAAEGAFSTASEGGEQVQVAVGEAGSAATKAVTTAAGEFDFPVNIPVPDIQFNPEVIDHGRQLLNGISNLADGAKASTAKLATLSSGWFFALVNLIPFDLTKVEIMRDFYQVLGILVECIRFPIAFEKLFGRIAEIMTLAISDIMKYWVSFSPLVWFWIVTAVSFCAVLLLFWYFNVDVPHQGAKSKKKVSDLSSNDKENGEALDWHKQNQKDGGRRYRRIKFMLFFMTTMYAPVSRNAMQVIACADKYAYARIKCTIINNITNVITGEPKIAYLSPVLSACPEIRSNILDHIVDKTTLKTGMQFKTQNEEMEVLHAASFLGGHESFGNYGGQCYTTVSFYIHLVASLLILYSITYLFPFRLFNSPFISRCPSLYSIHISNPSGF